MRLNHNLAAMSVFKEYAKVIEKQSGALNKITSGYKINSAKDDANAISKSEKMRMQIRGLQMASKNVQDGVSLLQTAEGGIENITSMLQRMRELVVQGQNGTNTAEDKQTIENEINEMMDGIDNIAKSTDMNGVKLLDNDGTIDMATGANVGEKIQIPTFNLTSSNLKGATGTKSLRDININTTSGANDALSIIDNSLSTVLSASSMYGALENRFETSMNSLNEIGDKIQDAESSIRDVDISEQIMEYSKDGILAEAGNAMMVQANKFPQDVLRILDKR